MKVLFVSSGNSKFFESAPFIKSQGESLKKEGVKLEYFHIKGKGLTGYLRNVSKLRKKIISYKPDVIHSHYSLTGWVTFLTFTGKPMVLSLMGSDTYGSTNKEGKITLISIFLKMQVFFIQFFYSTIIVKSENLKKSLWKSKSVYLVPNGVNFSHFKPLDKNECRKKLNLPLDKKIILFLGNKAEAWKNHALVEKAIKVMDSEDLVFCDPFPVSPKNVPLYLNACDVLTVPSYVEGSPNVVKEAMACNCPIIGANAGDIVSVIAGTEGCFITSYHIEDMVSNIKKAIQFNRKTNGRQNIEYMNEEIIAKKLIEIYGRIIK